MACETSTGVFVSYDNTWVKIKTESRVCYPMNRCSMFISELLYLEW